MDANEAVRKLQRIKFEIGQQQLVIARESKKLRALEALHEKLYGMLMRALGPLKRRK